ncbi:hypothetical protein [Streptomyces sp. NPDC050759]|uniref:hypothetical protein n=1 Tax=Streptomyces sp. NPDC050759 TaxID=3365635 RepID=UPI00378D9343
MNVAIHVYRAMREVVQAMDDVLPGKFEITRAGIVHDMIAPNGPHELTRLGLRKRLEKTMPMEIVAGPRYATRKDFVYGEDVTIGDWTISTDDLPRYKDQTSQPQPQP